MSEICPSTPLTVTLTEKEKNVILMGLRDLYFNQNGLDIERLITGLIKKLEA